MLKLAIRGMAAVALVLAAGGVFLGEGTVHPPRNLERTRSRISIAKAGDVTLRRPDGVDLAGSLYERPHAKGTVIVLHGQFANRDQMTGFANLFLRHGYNALTPDARAHGDSGDTVASYGVREAADLNAWTAKAPAGCVYGFGSSMGAAILLQALPAGRFRAAAAESPFSTFRAVALDRIGLGPLSYLAIEPGLLYARLRYGIDLGAARPEDGVANSTTPLLLVHPAGDRSILPWHSERMSRLRPGVELWEPDKGGHVQAWNAQPEEFERRVTGFLDANPCSEGAH